MRRMSRAMSALLLTGATVGVTMLTTATPASACTGDPCDGFCITYNNLPPDIREQVFHSETCPIR